MSAERRADMTQTRSADAETADPSGEGSLLAGLQGNGDADIGTERSAQGVGELPAEDASFSHSQDEPSSRQSGELTVP